MPPMVNASGLKCTIFLYGDFLVVITGSSSSFKDLKPCALAFSKKAIDRRRVIVFIVIR
jgi:hypothetical protein